MTGSRNSGGLPGICAAALILSIATVSLSLAQAPPPQGVGAPIRLLPRADDGAGAPAAATSEERPSPEQAATAEETERTVGDITIRALDTVDSSTAGTLDEVGGGFPLQMWAGAERRLVEQLLPRLPVGAPSRTQLSLLRRLLLSRAAVPEGPSNGPSLLMLRVERLAAAGLVQDMNALLAQTSDPGNDPALARARMDGLFLAGDNAGACRITGRMVGQFNDPIWQAAAAFCLALDGAMSRVELYGQLLREIGYDDPAFYSLIATLTDQAAPPLTGLAAPTALHLAMLRAARRPIPDEAATASAPMLLRTMATSPNAPVTLRLDAAERAEAIGAMSAETLRQLYASVAFPQDVKAKAMAAAEAAPNPVANAILYQNARQETQTAGRVEAIDRMLRGGLKTGRYATLARALRPLLQDVMPSPELTWFAASGGRALLIAGDIEGAYRWLGLVERMAESDARAAEAKRVLWPLLVVADAERRLAFETGNLAAWWQEQKQSDDPGRFARANLLYALMEALGNTVPTPAWDSLLDGPLHDTAPSAAPMLAKVLEQAAAEARLGEVVLLTLLVLGPEGPGAASPATLARAVRALRAVGLERDARALASEAMLTRSF